MPKDFPNEWLVNIGPGNGLVPSDTKPSSEQISFGLFSPPVI